MKWNVTLKYLRDTIKTLKPHMNVIELCAAEKNGVKTEIEYHVPIKSYVIRHRGKVAMIKNAKDAKFLFNWYVGSPESLNIHEVNKCFIEMIKAEVKPTAEKLLFKTQCTDQDGNTGSFLTDEQGNQITQTYQDNAALIQSDEYIRLKNDYKDDSLMYLTKK